MKIKMRFITLIFFLITIIALTIGTLQLVNQEDHSQHSNMPSAAEEMEKAKGR